MTWLERDNEIMERDFEKRELALSIKAALLMARIKIMHEEIFPAHRPSVKEIE